MGAVLLVLLYLATAGLLWGVAWGLRRAPSVVVGMLLTLVPLAFTAGGFWRQKVLAPTPMLAGSAPWANPRLMEIFVEQSSPANPLLLDPLSQMEPWRRAAREDLLFNPAQGGGAALLANGQSAVLFPIEVAARWLPSVRAATYHQAARLLLAVWGMFLLARALALREPAALAAAVVFAGGGFLQVWRAHPHSYAAAMAPWVLWALLALVRRPGRRPAVALGAAGALAFFAGHAETLLHLLLFALAAVAPTAWTHRRRLTAIVGWGLAAAGLAGLLAAPALLPFVENLNASAEWELRGGRPPEPVAVPLPQAVERLVPAVSFRALGDSFDGSWRGPENAAEVAGGAVGAAALVLLPAAFARRRRRRQAVGLLALGLLGLLVGAKMPLLSPPFGLVPLLGQSLLKRLSLWWVLAAALLVGLAVEALLRGRGRRAVAWGFAVIAALLGVLALLFPGARTATALGSELGGAAAALAGACWLATAVRRRRGRAYTLLAGEPPAVPGATADRSPPAPGVAEPVPSTVATGGMAATTRSPANADGRTSTPFPAPLGDAPLGGASTSWLHPKAAAAAFALLLLALLVPRAVLFAHWVPLATSLSFYPETGSVRFVAERLEPGERVAGLDAAMVPHAAAFFGFEDPRAYDPMTFAPYETFAHTLGRKGRFGWQRILDPERPALAFMGVRFLFDHPSMGERPGVERVFRSHDAVVYELPHPLPRLFFPARYRVFDEAEAALAAAVEIGDFSQLATAAGSGLPPPGEHTNPGAQVRRLAVSRHGRIEASVAAPNAALAVTSQPAIPGWHLTVDGAAARPVRVNGAFLGAWVPPGEHRLVLRYAPRSWSLGLGLAGLGLLLAGAGLLPRNRRRR